VETGGVKAIRDRYLNINQGCVVLEVLDGICVAKTFLSHDMVADDKFIVWYEHKEHVLKEISDCLAPEENSRQPFEALDEEIPISFCVKFFKRF